MIRNLPTSNQSLSAIRRPPVLLLTLLLLLLSTLPVLLSFRGEAARPPSQNISDGRVKGRVEQEPGVYRAIFSSPGVGTIFVNVPDDMAPGDVITGTVFAEPEGKDNERDINLALLQKLKVEIQGKNLSLRDRTFQLLLPAQAQAGPVTVKLLDDKGKTLASQNIPILTQRPTASAVTLLPTYGKIGGIFAVNCSCDGMPAATDSVKVGGKELLRLAESPRRRIVLNTSEVIGPTQIELIEHGRVTHGEFRNIRLNMSVSKATLRKGERATMLVEVRGLENLQEEIPLRIENRSPDVLTLSGGNQQFVTIRYSDVRNGGVYQTERQVTGIRVGEFRIEGLVIWRNPGPLVISGTTLTQESRTTPSQSSTSPFKGCQKFDEGTSTDPYSGFSGYNVTLTVPTSGGPQGPGDKYLRTKDKENDSWVSVAGVFRGDYSSLGGCYALCFDVRLFNDGAWGHKTHKPTVKILNGAISATFVASENLAITEAGGANPGWHRVCAPIGPLQNGLPPSSQDGSWTVTPANWPTILSNVTDVRLSSFDITSKQTEEAGYDNVCITPTCASSTNKDIQNGTGQTVDGLTIVIDGEFNTIDWHFDGDPRTSTFSFVTDEMKTYLHWEGINPPVAPGEVFHAGFRVWGGTQVLELSWRKGTKRVGDALQVNSGIQFPGDLPVLVLTNDSGPRTDRYVGNISVEWFDHEVALDQLNAHSTRRPIRTDLFRSPTMRIKACENVNLNFPRSPPANATYGMLRYTVSRSQNLDGPGNTTDFVSFARRPVERVPR